MPAPGNPLPTSARFQEVAGRVSPQLRQEVAAAGLRFGAPIFIRIFKESRELEVWIQSPSGPFRRFKTYAIAAHSGSLGPKLREGDGQAPEGFYSVAAKQMNPRSRFHLSFNLGFPNAFDRAHGRTGSFLMVHGNRVSIGCYAMTDARIEEIYTLAHAALQNGQASFQVHCFPFRMTPKRLANLGEKEKHWQAFWQNLKEGYDHFERTKKPPKVIAKGKHYRFADQ